MHAGIVHKIVTHIFSDYVLGTPLFGLDFYKNCVIFNDVKLQFTVHFTRAESNSVVYVRVQRIKSLLLQDYENIQKRKSSQFQRIKNLIEGIFHAGKK